MYEKLEKSKPKRYSIVSATRGPVRVRSRENCVVIIYSIEIDLNSFINVVLTHPRTQCELFDIIPQE